MITVYLSDGVELAPDKEYKTILDFLNKAVVCWDGSPIGLSFNNANGAYEHFVPLSQIADVTLAKGN